MPKHGHPSQTRSDSMKGLKNAALPPGERRRLNVSISLSKKRLAFFIALATPEDGREPTDQEVIDKARKWIEAQIDSEII